jgi:riboflavin synthase
MFTGLIEAVGSVDSVHGSSNGMKIGIHCPTVACELAIGDSINVDGVCQTVVAASASAFAVEAVGDTLEKTTFRKLRPGAKVNLERALRADGRFGGHIVTGHVAGAARILSCGSDTDAAGSESGAWFLVLELDPAWADRIVPEGSIAVDGISLTVAEVTCGAALASAGSLRVRISLIPHTRQTTTLSLKKEGDLMNIELDILASYAQAAMKSALAHGGLTLEKLSTWGYR